MTQYLSDLWPDCDAAAASLKIAGITQDSRQVKSGYLFAALKGSKSDGVQFIPQALENGAGCILIAEDADVILPDNVAVIHSREPRLALAQISARFYKQQPETILAVTGTSGKTSVVSFLRQIMARAGDDIHAAALGTIGVTTDKGTDYGSLTTPDPIQLHQLLANLAKDDITHLAMEASSHGLDQYRLDGVRLSAAGFTNLGRDHMDYHPTIEDYFLAKARLFTDVLPEGKPAVVWVDSDYGRRVVDLAQNAARDVFSVGREGKDLTLIEASPAGFTQRLTLYYQGQTYYTILPLAGDFQVENALVAAGLALSVGFDATRVFKALEGLKGAPGRLEHVASLENGGMVFVDYAHKPDAIEHVLKALRPFAQGRLMIVFGAGGDRDTGKRPLMGQAASHNADVVIVTDDNPRSEDPAAIRQAIMQAADNALEISDREEAIYHAVSSMQSGDILVVAGKGHETGQIIGDEVLAFSDHEAVARSVAKLAECKTNQAEG
jgi:UDP-N-acetylmuramyl-tripeptide synthetase